MDTIEENSVEPVVVEEEPVVEEPPKKPTVEKKKRVQTEKQRLAFEKARQTRAANLAKKKLEKAQENTIKTDNLEVEKIRPKRKYTKKVKPEPVVEAPPAPVDSDDEDLQKWLEEDEPEHEEETEEIIEEVIVKKKKPKAKPKAKPKKVIRKIVYEDSDEEEDEEEEIVIKKPKKKSKKVEQEQVEPEEPQLSTRDRLKLAGF